MSRGHCTTCATENQGAHFPAPTSENVTVTRKRPREYLTEAEIERLMAVARDDRYGHRKRDRDPSGLPSDLACSRGIGMSRFAICVLTVLPAIVGITTAFGADSENGLRIARRWCASCQVITAGQRTGSDQAPPFSTIARIPNFDASKIALFLLDPHPKMPEMSLTRDEAADLAA